MTTPRMLDLGNVHGSRWHLGTEVVHPSGTSRATLDMGVVHVGDLYLNTDTWNIYQCTAVGTQGSADWTFVGCLASSVPGADGADGATILNGEGEPGPDAGKDGDYYLDRESGAFYSKENGAWGIILNFNLEGTSVDEQLSDSSTNPVENRAIKAALDGKQNTLVFDAEPTGGSSNPVTSGGVFNAIRAISTVFDGTIAMDIGNANGTYGGLHKVHKVGRTVFLTIHRVASGQASTWERKDSRTYPVVARIPAGFRPVFTQLAWGHVKIKGISETYICGFYLIPPDSTFNNEQLSGHIVLSPYCYNRATLGIVKTAGLTFTELELSATYLGET